MFFLNSSCKGNYKGYRILLIMVKYALCSITTLLISNFNYFLISK